MKSCVRLIEGRGPLPVGRRPGRVCLGPTDLPGPEQAFRQPVAILGDLWVVAEQHLALGHRLLAPWSRLGRPPEPEQCRGRVDLAVRQGPLVVGYRRVLGGEGFADHLLSCVMVDRLRDSPALVKEGADVQEGIRQSALESGDGGVVVDQLLLDRDARRYATSASDGFPVFNSTKPRLLWLIPSHFRKSVTAGLSSTSFCWIAMARRYATSASDGFPVFDSSVPRLLSAEPQRGSEAGDGGVVVDQLLPDCEGLTVRDLRLRWFARIR